MHIKEFKLELNRRYTLFNRQLAMDRQARYQLDRLILYAIRLCVSWRHRVQSYLHQVRVKATVKLILEGFNLCSLSLNWCLGKVLELCHLWRLDHFQNLQIYVVISILGFLARVGFSGQISKLAIKSLMWRLLARRLHYSWGILGCQIRIPESLASIFAFFLCFFDLALNLVYKFIMLLRLIAQL